jgi:host factor-I protein
MDTIQDFILNKAQQENIEVTIILVKGFHIKGTISNFDKFTVGVTVAGKQQVIYKHAISTIIPSKPILA